MLLDRIKPFLSSHAFKLFIVIGFIPLIKAEGQSIYDGRSAKARCTHIVNTYCKAFVSSRTVGGVTYYKLRTGVELACEDGRSFDLSEPQQFLERLYDSDLASTLAYVYPFQNNLQYPLRTFSWDPGRLRNEDLLDAVYGASPQEVERRMTTVHFLGKRVSFNREAGAARALARVSEEITARYPQIARNFWRVREFAGTYNWRHVSGSPLRSVHSWAAAIDMTDWTYPQYWKWNARCRPGLDCKNPSVGKNEATMSVNTNVRMDEFSFPGEPYPGAIVDVFEKHGFIWGGKWHHYDSMHFEYRPEFLAGHPQCSLINE